MIGSNYSKEISVYYKYKNVEKEIKVFKSTSLKELREAIESAIKFSLSKMKLMHNSNNILLNNENYKIYDFFGDVKTIHLIVLPKEFTEESYLQTFEKAFNAGLNTKSIEVKPTSVNKNESDNKTDPKYIKKIVSDAVYNPKIAKRPLCNKDELNEATYICTKCRLFWCKPCIKYEVHKADLIELDHINKYLEQKRKDFTKEIDEQVINDKFYPNLSKIEFILNEKVSVIEKQYKEMLEIITKIKESQMKMLIESYYQTVDNKIFKTIPNDIQYFKNKILEINTNYNKENIEENLNNNEVLVKFKDVIKHNYDEFKFKYTNYFDFFTEFENFNLTFKSQLEAKYKQSNLIKESLIKNDKEKINNQIKEKPSKSNKSAYIFKMKYYNSIMQYDHSKNKIDKLKEFNDRFNFKSNYQVYSGNIFLNHKDKLFIVSGNSFNMCYFYDIATNEIYLLNSLAENHCRGALVFLDSLNLLICLSGKFTGKCEKFDFTNIKLPINSKDIIDYTKNTDPNWSEFPPLNYQRQNSAYYIHNHFLYVFFGYNGNRGGIDIIERIDIKAITPSSYWEVIQFTNSKFLDLKLSSHGLAFANSDEVYILGGCINDRFTDKIYKFNFIQNAIFETKMIIPGINEHEYFRFWEEAVFKPISSFGQVFNNDDDYTFGMFDARDKLHLFNSRTFKYTIV